MGGTAAVLTEIGDAFFLLQDHYLQSGAIRIWIRVGVSLFLFPISILRTRDES